MHLSPGFLSALQLPISPTVTTVAQDRCTPLTFSAPNTTITSATHYTAMSSVVTGSALTCFTPFQQISADMCRVAGVVTTSSDSTVRFETWLPDIWYGRQLVVGNGGLGGCMFFVYKN